VSERIEGIAKPLMKRLALFTIIVALTLTSISPLLMKDADAHDSDSVIVDSQSYRMKPGQSLTQVMRVCVLTGGDFTLNSITFNGNYSDWAACLQTYGRQIPTDNGKYPARFDAC
jgi:hypothetical protein